MDLPVKLARQQVLVLAAIVIRAWPYLFHE